MTHLVIVESPAKAKTIKRFLGKDYIVEASMGHVRDLPSSTLGVDVEKGFVPEYEVPAEKATVVKHLRAALKKADDVWIATDEDREGEAIGWHLLQVLGVKNQEQVRRIVFHEITETAIKEAVAHPRTIDHRLVDAQQARRILDRLVGYTLSPFLWKKVYRGLSAGRVQSVAVRIIVDREREIQAFTAQEYWTVEAQMETEKRESFVALLQKRDGEKFVPASQAEVDGALREIEGKDFAVAALEEREVKKNPPAPFTTSTLQQEAARKLGFSVKQTMVVAQQLYEGVALGKGEGSSGLITYMRTDSVNLSKKALEDAARVIQEQYGREYVLAEPRTFKSRAKGAQEAHEAIRPTEMDRTPASLEGVLDHQQLKLYTLIWNRTMATQMPAAEFRRVGADIAVGRYGFRATGQTVLFDGFMRVYSEGRDERDERADAPAEEEDGEKLLPALAQGQSLDCTELKPQQHFTKPPPRYTEASLVKKMEEEGIGRPSTYAPTISTIQQRGYITKEGKQLAPADVAFTVTDLLAEHFPDIVDLAFTATMEQSLDDIAEGVKEANQFLGGFYGPFKERIDVKSKEVKKEDVMKERALGMDPATGLPVVVKSGRFGPYVQLGVVEKPAEDAPKTKGGKKVKAPKSKDLKTASLPKHIASDAVTLEQALALLQFPRVIGQYEGGDVKVSLGRYGPYLSWGEKNTLALPKDADPVTVTIAQATGWIADAAALRKKAAEPLQTFAADPVSGKPITVRAGRYGPYVTDGVTNASLRKDMDPATISFEEAAALLEKKRNAPPSRWKGRKKG